MLPEHRLAILLQQVKKNQIANCLYHNTAASPSLYQDHTCQPDRFPRYPSKELTKSAGQVWYVEFSHDGTRLARCGKDGYINIFDVGTWEVLQSMHIGGDGGIGSLAWSPDDSMIVACGWDRMAELWDANVSIITYIMIAD